MMGFHSPPDLCLSCGYSFRGFASPVAKICRSSLALNSSGEKKLFQHAACLEGSQRQKHSRLVMCPLSHLDLKTQTLIFKGSNKILLSEKYVPRREALDAKGNVLCAASSCKMPSLWSRGGTNFLVQPISSPAHRSENCFSNFWVRKRMLMHRAAHLSH